MPRNGSGTYAAPSLPTSWNPAASGGTIDPADWNTLLTDISTALTGSVAADGQTTISANIPFATHRITGLGEPLGAQDAATKAYADNATWSALGGLTTSRASATTLAVAAGKCNDSTNTSGSTIYLPSGMTKSTAGSWASGNNSNGMGNGLTIGNATWYHTFGIINSGAADVYFDTSVTAANKPTSTTAFRRIGSFLTDGSAQIIAYVQDGDFFQWSTPVADVSASAPGTAAVTRTLTVPTGVNVVAKVILSLLNGSAVTNAFAYLSDLACADVTQGETGSFASGFPLWRTRSEVRTNTSSQIRSRVTGIGDGNVTIGINTLGWVDPRGKNV